MTPKAHPSNTSVLHAPPGVPREECVELPITRLRVLGQPFVRSYWELSPEEIEGLTKGAALVFQSWGTSHPPIFLGVEVVKEARAPPAWLKVKHITRQGGNESAALVISNREITDDEISALRIHCPSIVEFSPGHDHDIQLEPPRFSACNMTGIAATNIRLGDPLVVSASPMRTAKEAHFGGHSYEASLLRELLASIHGDGARHLAAHGLDKACADAQEQVARWRTATAV